VPIFAAVGGIFGRKKAKPMPPAAANIPQASSSDPNARRRATIFDRLSTIASDSPKPTTALLQRRYPQSRQSLARDVPPS
jgi:hypothetical protein